MQRCQTHVDRGGQEGRAMFHRESDPLTWVLSQLEVYGGQHFWSP